MRRNKSLETKSRICQCALELLEKNGTADLSVEEVALKAGISKPTFYCYYRSKYEMINEVLHRNDDEFYESANKAMQGQPVEQQLVLLVESMFHFLQNKIGARLLREIYQSRLNEKCLSQDLIDDDKRLYAEIISLLEQGQAQGVFEASHPVQKLALFTVTVLNGILYTWSVDEDNFDLFTDGITCLRTFLKGICTSQAIIPGETSARTKGERTIDRAGV